MTISVSFPCPFPKKPKFKNINNSIFNLDKLRVNGNLVKKITWILISFLSSICFLGIQDHGKDVYRNMSCLIDVLYKRKINVSFTVTRLTQADTRRISTAPPPTVTNPSITTDICPLTPQSPLDLLQGTPTDKRFILLQATPTDKWFILQGGMNITALRLSLLTGYPPQGCPQTDPRMPRGPMGPLRGL